MNLEANAVVVAMRRWWWILLLGPLVGGGLAYVVAKSQSPLYRATAVVWVQTGSNASGFDPNEIQSNIELAETLRHLVTVEANLSTVIADLQLSQGVDELRQQISVGVEQGTPLIEVTAQDTRPEGAASIANAVANQFSTSIDQLGMAPAPAQPVADGTDGPTASVLVIPAEAPVAPFAPRTSLMTLVGVLVGLLLAAGALYVAALLQPRVTTRRDIATRQPHGSPGVQAQT